MRYASKLRLFTVLMALIWPVHAAIEVSFIEDAPKDRFVIGNTGGCTVEDLRLVIDLGPSAGGLYFDTSSAGAGVQVFQPFEAVNGAVRLVRERGGPGSVEDGQNSLEVQDHPPCTGRSGRVHHRRRRQCRGRAAGSEPRCEHGDRWRPGTTQAGRAAATGRGFRCHGTGSDSGDELRKRKSIRRALARLSHWSR